MQPMHDPQQKVSAATENIQQMQCRCGESAVCRSYKYSKYSKCSQCGVCVFVCVCVCTKLGNKYSKYSKCSQCGVCLCVCMCVCVPS